MATDRQKNAVKRLHRKRHAFTAGDLVTCVSPDSDQFEITCTIWEPTSSDMAGLEIDQAGLEDEEILFLKFNKDSLDEAGIALDIDGHFLIGGERYDFAANKPFLDKRGPIAGSHADLLVMVRKSIELNNTAETTGLQTRDWSDL